VVPAVTPRPRDPFGRPLPAGTGAAIEPDPTALPPAETLQEADTLLRQGRAFRAHEVFEAIWKATPGDERELWRGLAQLAVGITHAQRGNARGSATLLRRGAENLTAWEGQQPYGVPISALRAWAVQSAARPLPAEQLLAALPALVETDRRSGG
jgi:hypothetical protein